MNSFRLIAVVIASTSFFANANLSNIPSGFVSIANEAGVPSDVFYSIAIRESRVATNKNRSIPWPWAVNHRGTALYFRDRDSMYSYLKKLVQEGDRNFDMGLVQTNWRWHNHRYASLWEATNPVTSATAGAAYLRELIDKNEGDVWKAVGKYHSPGNKSRASNYRQAVKQICCSEVNPLCCEY